ncbi:ribosomal protein S5 domain 2-type protein [Pelagophyceae sp. CCMP2097]|nr:ribosomal protein S5 domain 2-type protein [Pelagophyceae sp. CCMP2097]
MASAAAAVVADEADALSAIFGEEVSRLESPPAYVFDFKAPQTQSTSSDDSLTIKVVLPMGYPDTAPTVTVGGGDNTRHLETIAQSVSADAGGATCVFDVVSAVREAWEAARAAHSEQAAASEARQDASEDAARSRPRAAAAPGPEFACSIVAGDVLADRKSTFQAFLAVGVSSQGHVDWVLHDLLNRPKLRKASHNMWAYRYASESVTVTDSDDDGEGGASIKMAELLRLLGADGALVLVSRCYGGVHLGADRFKHVAKLTQRILEDHGFQRRRK